MLQLLFRLREARMMKSLLVLNFPKYLIASKFPNSTTFQRPNDSQVLVTGATGFVGSHCVKRLLESGYKVRGTVRDLKDFKKIRPVLELDKQNTKVKMLELVEADLLDKDCWKRAVKGCTFVLHVASPFPLTEPDVPEDLLKPAIQGTVHVLQAAAEEPRVKRVVMCSSVVAIMGGRTEKFLCLDESHWALGDVAKIGAYAASKTLAEKQAWKLAQNEKLELTVINPAFILGPTITGNDCSSGKIIAALLSRKYPLVPKMGLVVVDVRDLSCALLKAMTADKAAGKRIVVCTGSTNLTAVAKTLHEEFGPQGYNVPTVAAPNWMIYLASKVFRNLREVYARLGTQRTFSSENRESILKMDKMIGWKSAAISMAYSLIEFGLVSKTEKYTGVPGKYKVQ